ncbi:hypothetical protein CgunFtcFv8_005444 [Champsocephalus gunnari]|uniref:Uncharacterized protein n=1 Tax=Champsocephalus gunnari TaxID=52237 RepID=A0AAN8CXH8_CHAGU|nr:hypothetical protein CgunFtcFv8_005444 [Champsocephalus gunnari]
MVFGCLGGVSRLGESLQERPLLPHSPRCLCRVAAALEDLSPPKEALIRAWSLWRNGVAGRQRRVHTGGFGCSCRRI